MNAGTGKQVTSYAPSLTWRRVLLDGGAINGALGVLIFASLRINAEMWVHDYPPDIKEAFGPKSRKAQLQTAVLAPLFFGILLGGIAWSLRRLRAEHGGVLSFKDAFWHTYALFAFFWLFDLTVLDWLIFGLIQPSWVILPGTEGMAGYTDLAFHLKTSLPALPLMAVPALIIAFFARSRS